jgi:CheY-like chemotaxis protein
MSSNLILIVDDDPAIIEMIAELLKYEGYNVVTCQGGREAIALARTDPPALILLDLMMPEMSGWQVIATLRASQQTKALPIVLLSARRDLAATAQELGVADYLEKPFDLDALLSVVRRYVAPGDDRAGQDGLLDT